MSKTRYAKFPLQCEAVRKANNAVWDKYPKLKGRKLNMSSGDYKYRKVWMDAYVKAAGEDSIQDKKPKRKPDDPVTDCRRNTSPKSNKGDLAIEVVDKKGKAIPGADYRLIGPPHRQGNVGPNGKTLLKELPQGKYRVHAWAKLYSEESETTDVVARMKWDVTVKLKRELPGNLPVRVRDSNGRAISAVQVKLVKSADLSGRVHRETRTKPTEKDGTVMFTSLRYGNYKVTGRKGKYRTDTKVGKVSAPSVAKRVELTYLPPNMWLGVAGGWSADLALGGRYFWKGKVYRLDGDTSSGVEWAKLMASGWKVGPGLGASGGLIAVFAHGINTVGEFKDKSKWSSVDFDVALVAGLSGVLKGLKGIGKVVKTWEKYKKLQWSGEQLYKNKEFRKAGVYTIPIWGKGAHLWIGWKHGKVELILGGRGLDRS